MNGAQIIQAFRTYDPGISPEAIKDALEDGEALLALGFGDGDQEAVEEAHTMIVDMLRGRAAG